MEYVTYRQEKDREFCVLCPLFFASTGFVGTNTNIQFVDMLRYAQLDIFASRQIRYNLACGRFRYDINPSFA